MNKVKAFNTRVLYRFMTGVIITALFVTGCSSIVNKDAQRIFQERKAPISVTVYPVNIVIGDIMLHDRDIARRVVTFLQDENIADPVLGNINHIYPFKWGINQAKMFSRSGEAFAYQVKNDDIQTDYALLVEVLCGGSESNVVGVEYYLVDKDGRFTDGSLCNSDWEEFKQVKPASRNGGIDLAIVMLRRDWNTR